MTGDIVDGISDTPTLGNWRRGVVVRGYSADMV